MNPMPPSQKNRHHSVFSNGLSANGGKSYPLPSSSEQHRAKGAWRYYFNTLVKQIKRTKWMRYALPLASAFCVAIVVSIASPHDTHSEAMSFDVPTCQSSVSPQTCELAAQVAGADAIEHMANSKLHIPTFEEEAALLGACEQEASFFSGHFDSPISSTSSVISETLPEVFLVDIRYPNPANSAAPYKRTACVASLDGWGATSSSEELGRSSASAMGRSGPQVVALDEIPLDWPLASYQGDAA